MKLNNESKTLFIPLYGKALMSKENLFLKDTKAEEIISTLDFDFESSKQSKWLSMYMSLRALIIDDLVNDYLSKNPKTTVIHLGCGLDSRISRITSEYNKFYDVDYREVIKIRKEFFEETDNYKMIGSSVTSPNWYESIPETENILIIMEGLTMYLSSDEIKELITMINLRFDNVYFIIDAYTKKGVKGSKIKNPVNKLGAEIKYGFDKPEEFLSLNDNLEYKKTHLIKRNENNLKGITKFIFNNIYCGKISQSMYKIYEFKLRNR